MRGIGRDRLARYVVEFLSGAGFRVDETNETGNGAPQSRIVGDLSRPNPAVPSSLHHVELRTAPTAGGSVLRWEAPATLVQEADRSRAQRFATELVSNIEQRVVLESRGSGKITRDPSQVPFLPKPAGAPAPVGAEAKPVSPRAAVEGSPSGLL